MTDLNSFMCVRIEIQNLWGGTSWSTDCSIGLVDDLGTSNQVSESQDLFGTVAKQPSLIIAKEKVLLHDRAKIAKEQARTPP